MKRLVAILIALLPATAFGQAAARQYINVSTFGRTLVDDADASAMRTTLGLVIGTNIQAFDADLTDLADGTLTGSKVDTSTLAWADNIEQTFNPGANFAGLNVGSQNAEPDTPTEGDLFYDLDDEALKAYINAGWVSLGAGGGGAPTDATYITQTANGSLSAEQALGALATGILKNTVTTGVLSIAAQGTDYYAPGGTDVADADVVDALTISGGVINNSAIGGVTPTTGTFTTLRSTTFQLKDATLLSFLTVATLDDGVLTIAGDSVELPPLASDLTVGEGGTGAGTLTGLLQGNGTSAFTAITNSTTVGQILHVTGSNTYAWGQVDLADPDAITGLLPDANIAASITRDSEAAAAYQPLDADLTTYAGITPSASVQTLLGSAANLIEVRNSTTAQTQYIYNTYTDASNYERLAITWASNVAKIRTENAGTGTARHLYLGAAGTDYWRVSSNGHFLALSNNAYDIGASGANMPRDLYIADDIAAGGDGSFGGPVTIPADVLDSTWNGLQEAAPKDAVWDYLQASVQPLDADLSDLADGTLTGTKVDPASLTVVGTVELATGAETTTGTDAGRAVTPDGLAESDFGTRSLQLTLAAPATDGATGDGIAYYYVPASLNGWNIIRVHAQVVTAGTTGTSDWQIARVRSGTPADVLSTKLTIDSAETGSDTAATAAVINTANDDLATHDLLRIDCDALSTTKPKGPFITIEVQKP